MLRRKSVGATWSGPNHPSTLGQLLRFGLVAQGVATWNGGWLPKPWRLEFREHHEKLLDFKGDWQVQSAENLKNGVGQRHFRQVTNPNTVDIPSDSSAIPDRTKMGWFLRQNTRLAIRGTKPLA